MIQPPFFLAYSNHLRRDAGECLGAVYKHVVTIEIAGADREGEASCCRDTSQTIQTMGKNGQK